MIKVKGTVLRAESVTGQWAMSLVYEFGDSVTMDGGDTKGCVVGVSVYPYDVEYKVAWWNNGAHASEWFSQSRLAGV